MLPGRLFLVASSLDVLRGQDPISTPIPTGGVAVDGIFIAQGQGPG